MAGVDEFSKHYAELLDGSYDCVDRIVLDAYFRLAQGPGGFRHWWRNLFGTDANLDDTHLMRFAGRFARRLRAYAQTAGIPLEQADSRKCDMATNYEPEDPSFTGVYCILWGRAPAPVRHVRRFGTDGMDIRVKKPYPYVNHYSFYIVDPEWGRLVIRFCPHPPFNAMIILNGHEHVAIEARERGVRFSKDGNCFTDITNAAGLNRVAETMRGPCSVGRLEKVCERWLYTAVLCFALDRREQQRTGFQYSYSVYQSEYSRNLLFTRGHQMEQVFESLIDRNRARLDLKTVRTVFGRKHRPYFRHPGKAKHPRIEIVVERLVYALTVFRIHFGMLTVKMYSKGERVLRIEAIAHNAKREFPRYGIRWFPDIVESLRGILERFLNVLDGIDASFVDSRILDTWAQPCKVGRTPVGGIDMTRPRMRAVAAAVLALAVDHRGFTAPQVAAKVAEILRVPSRRYRSTQAAYDIKKLRGKGLVQRMGRSRRYMCTDQGHRRLAAFDAIYSKALLPLLANAGKRSRCPKKHMSQIDRQYDRVRAEVQALLPFLGLSPAA